MALKALVVKVGAGLGRSASDVEPFLQMLADNWYDSVDGVRDATADDLASIGLPRRFAVELAAAAAGGKGGDRKGKSKGKGKDEEKGSRRGGRSRGRGEVVVPIDLNGCDPEFLFKPKILGKRGSHVHHIQDQTGKTIELKGTDDDGFMELVIVGPDDRSMGEAVRMCEDLINTIFDEYDDFARAGGKRGRKGDRDGKGKKGKSKGKGKEGKEGKGKERKGKGDKRTPEEGEIEERVPVDTEGIDPGFYMRAKLVGQGGRNAKHIEEETGCRVQVERDGDGDGMAFVIHSKDEDAIATARGMCEDLLGNVMEEARSFSPSAKPSTSGKGKRERKGKGKGKGDDAEERPRKAAKTE